MARKPRIEIEGGLYHVLARGNNRQKIFVSEDDYLKMLSLLERQKSKLPFYLYAFCLMPNHLHLLIERQADSIGRIMHRLLTGYSQYYIRIGPVKIRDIAGIAEPAQTNQGGTEQA